MLEDAVIGFRGCREQVRNSRAITNAAKRFGSNPAVGGRVFGEPPEQLADGGGVSLEADRFQRDMAEALVVIIEQVSDRGLTLVTTNSRKRPRALDRADRIVEPQRRRN